jgi:hypothetical protein
MLEHFFGSKTRVKLLQIFFRSPERPFYVRELSRMVDIQLNAVRRELANLEMIGIISQAGLDDYTSGPGTERSKYYQLQKDFILFQELQTLLNKAQLLEQRVFIEEIKNRGGIIKLFLLTGLFTQDTSTDTDILLVGTIKLDVVEKIISRFEKEMDRSVRYTIMDEREFSERKELGDVFLYNIFDSKYLLVINDYQLAERN